MGATYKLKRKTADGTLEDVILQGVGGGGVPFIAKENISITSVSNVALKWTVDGVNNITTPTDGMVIALRVPGTSGSGFGVVFSIDGGATYYPLVRDANTKIYTDLAAGSTAILTFNASQTVPAVKLSASGSTTITGCWQISDKNTDQYVKQNYRTDNSNYALLLKNSSGITSTGSTTSEISYTNSIYANPSTGTIYANDFVVDGKSIVGTSIPKKISSTTTTININASTVGAYFNLFGTVDGANELTIGSETIALDSNLVYFVSVEGVLYGIVSGSYIWRVTVRVGDDSGTTNYYNYQITSTSGFNISDTGQVGSGYCRYTGILYE